MKCAWFLVAVIAVWSVTSASALTFQVEPQTEECLYEHIEDGKLFKMRFEVTRGGLFDIQFRVYNPRNRVIYEKMAYFSRKDTENLGEVEFTATATGPHKICFDNTMSRWTAKVVT